MSTQISLTPQQEAIFGAIQAAFPTIKERTYPKVPDSWIYQLWGPLIINSIALAALVGAMVWMQFFTPKGMVIFKTYQVRSSRVPIPTIDIYLPLAAMFGVVTIVTQTFTLRGAFNGEGHVQNITGLLYGSYLPISMASWLLAGSLLHSSCEMLRVRRPHSFKLPHPLLLIGELYVLPVLFVISSGVVLILMSTKLNHAIGSAHAFIRVFERLAGEAAPTGAELEVLGQQLARVEAQFPIAQKWEKVLFLEYIVWVVGFLSVIPTSFTMAWTLKKFMDLETVNLSQNTDNNKSNKRTTGNHNALSKHRYLQLKIRYHFWLWLTSLGSIWCALWLGILIYSFASLTKAGPTSHTAIIIQFASHWVNCIFSCGIALVWAWKTVFGSSSARQQMHEDAATSFAQPDKSRHRRGNTEDVKILIETETKFDGPTETLVVELDGMPRPRRTSSERMCDFFGESDVERQSEQGTKSQDDGFGHDSFSINNH